MNCADRYFVEESPHMRDPSRISLLCVQARNQGFRIDPLRPRRIEGSKDQIDVGPCGIGVLARGTQPGGARLHGMNAPSRQLHLDPADPALPTLGVPISPHSFACCSIFRHAVTSCLGKA